MDAEEAKLVLDKLANREMKEFRINKEDFLSFREVLVQRADFKHFRGNAQHNGEVIYTYLEEARS
ncbi:abortive phage infection protein [Peribacillus sp. NPDC097295]|uniref:abortive phage infection protein n=1 Tax=Peribacillus sp. NPDC097295 TaxID=3364402 RepID=UPI0038083030